MLAGGLTERLDHVVLLCLLCTCQQSCLWDLIKMLLSIGMLMLSATQIYTILTVQLFVFLNLLPVEADILAFNFENATQTFDDLPARFGYRLPTEGLKG
ncbi:hypothetical protein JD844_007404 [Phrynosoma platyrhinos]|uniref:Uncharacterized protein n=1 Tax=Phrynosoma platyrhinos TaxID=52577 RepID=A0ABQ7T2X6_PHRPL|nr:hypothetical protein JD844_007404 [Phrynosoma platyrhinos]